MNGYFIHTIELNKNITYKELEKIKDNLHCFPKNKGSKNYSWRSTHYKSSGIIIAFWNIVNVILMFFIGLLCIIAAVL